MGFLSNLFDKHNESYVRTWVERRWMELKNSNNDSSIETMFTLMIYFVSMFGAKSKSSASNEMTKAMDVSEHFSGDATIFELGCYIRALIDFWLVRNAPHRRADICTAFDWQFVPLFTKALGSVNISELFLRRVDGFGKIINNNEDEQKLYAHLSLLVSLTRDNRQPKAYDFDDDHLMQLVRENNIAPLETMGIKMRLKVWEGSLFPGFFAQLAKYIQSH